MGRDILKQSLMPLLQEHFNADSEQSGYIAHAVVMAAAASFRLGKGDDLPSNKTPSQAQAIISKSWDSLARFFPRLPSKSQSEKRVYPANHARWRCFRVGSDRVSAHLLVVRALRLCDQRSVQLEKIKVITLNQLRGRYPGSSPYEKLSDFLLPFILKYSAIASATLCLQSIYP